MDPLPPINKVYSLLIQEERQRSIGRSSGPFVESTALAAKVTGTGSTASNGSKNYKGKGRDRPICSHCGLQGHPVEKCQQNPQISSWLQGQRQSSYGYSSFCST